MKNDRKVNFILNNNFNPMKQLNIQKTDKLRYTLDPTLSPKFQNRQIIYQTGLRNTLNPTIINRVQKTFRFSKQTPIYEKVSTLKNTLLELEEKISSAKNHLANNPHKNYKIKSVIPRESDCFVDAIQLQDISSISQNSNLPNHNFELQPLRQIKKEQTLYNNKFKKIKTYYIGKVTSNISNQNKLPYDHLVMSYKVFKACKDIQSPSFSQIQQRKLNLKKNYVDMHKKTLVLDIDETLLHCDEESNKPCDMVLPIKLSKNEYVNAYINLRPYLISFLKKMTLKYQIIAFTASQPSYADVVLNEIDPQGQIFKHRLYRQHCFEIHPSIFTKDLRIINRNLKDMVLVDNAPYSYIFQLQNGIPIIPYYSGDDDDQLPLLQKYLDTLATCEDVRQLNKETFRLHSYSSTYSVQDIIQLYIKQN